MISDKSTPPPRPAPPPQPALPARRLTDAAGEPKTVIGPRTRIQGQVTGEDPVDLAGTLEGSATTSAMCWVRAGARVVGDLAAQSLVIDGEVVGQTLVAEKIEIGAAARVRAGIRAQVVAIAEGALFEGQVHMQGREPAAPLAFKEKRKDRPPEDRNARGG